MPAGVYARIVEGRILYVKITGEEKTIPIRGIISGASYGGRISLRAYDADLIEWETLSSMPMPVAAFARGRLAKRLLGKGRANGA
jgi:hypothetical protein